MRLIFPALAGFIATSAAAQTLPGPADYDAMVVPAMHEVMAYCATPPGATAATMAGVLGVYITFDFPDAQELSREEREAEAAAAVNRLIADGTLISDADGIRLPDCPVTDRQVELRLRERVFEFRFRFTQQDGIDLLSGAMAAYGCTVRLEDEAAFLSFAIRHVAGLYDIPLPDPLPTEEDDVYTPFAEQLLFVLDDAGSDMRRSGQMITQGDTARLAGCEPPVTAPVPGAVAAEAMPPDPATAAARAEALQEADHLAMLDAALAGVGCHVPYEARWLFARYFAHSGLAALGVDLAPMEFVLADRDLALEGETDHPYGAAIAAFNYYEVYDPTALAALDAGRLAENDDGMSGVNCTPTGDLSALDPFRLESD